MEMLWLFVEVQKSPPYLKSRLRQKRVISPGFNFTFKFVTVFSCFGRPNHHHHQQHQQFNHVSTRPNLKETKGKHS